MGRRFSPDGLGPIGVVESWDGTQWSLALVPKPSGAVLNGVSCLSSTRCVAVGLDFGTEGALVEAWNGTKWKVVPNPDHSTNSQLNGVSCVSKANCTAVGSYNRPGARKRVLVEHWNGQRWKVQRNPASLRHRRSELDGVSCPSRSFCVAVGSAAGGPLIERWNGTSWKIQSRHRSPGHSLLGVSCASRKSCAAVGRSPLGNHGGPFAEGWDGNAWSIEPSASPSNTTGTLEGVACPSGTACIAVGGGPLAERWNGSSWSTETVPKAAGKSAALQGVSCPSANLCMAVGQFVHERNSEEFTRTLAEMWTP